MVYIKKLTIQGFKSFGPKRVSIELEKGFIVITGPNGGGKSNVLDAIRFTLGELSAHNLRVGRMAELVHDGSQTGWAKTSITLDNSDGVLPIEASEVTISRKILRGGESEYYVNGRQVSRNELLTLLSMANIKPSGFNIIPQGSVVEIAEKSGSELRKMLEEVAGISDYEKKKAEAEEQLAIAEKNLAIAKASTKEVKTRVKQLEKERNQAYRRKLVEEFLNEIEKIRLEKNIRSLEKELEEIDSQLLSIENELGRLETRKSQLMEKKRSIEEILEEKNSSLSSIEHNLNSLDLQRKNLESKLNDLRIRISTFKERAVRLLKERDYFLENHKKLLEKLKELRGEEESVLEELTSLSEELAAIKKAEEEALSDFRRIEKEYQELRSRIEKERKRIYDEKLRLEAEMTKKRIRISEVEKRIKSITSEGGKLLELEEKGYRELSKLREKVEQLLEEERRLSSLIEELEKRRKEYRSRISLIERLEERLKAILEEIASAGVLEPEDEAERIMAALREAGLEGVKGFLKDAIEADERILGLIDSASGGWLKALVVEKFSLALGIAKILGEVGLRVKIIPLDVASQMGGRLKLKGISFKEEWAEDALKYILREVSFSNKLRSPDGEKIVYDGIILHPDLRLETTSPDKSILSEVASREYKNSMKILERLRRELGSLRKRLEEAGAELERLKLEKYQKRIERKGLEESIRKTLAQMAETIIKGAEETLRLKLLEAELPRLRRELKEIEKKLRDLRSAEEEVSSLDLEAYERDLSRRRSVYEEYRLRRSELEIRIRDLENKLARIRREIERTGSELKLAENRMASAEEEYANVSRLISESHLEVRAYGVELGEAIYGIACLSDLRRKILEEVRRISEELKPISDEIAQIDADEQKRVSAKSSLQIRRAQLEVQLKNLRERISAIGESGISLPQLPDEKLEELRHDLEEELKELEIVNQLAPSQYEELIGNYKLRSARIAELEAERQEIIRFIEWVESEKKRIFMETFNKVADAFEEYFSRLTGGRGWLRLENPENPFEGGVEMILAFPGKQPRSARAASGGEKSVAAVALLLALQGLTPADFYIFDEVDAHMDLEYSRRLAELFKEMAKRTQIIVISLKDVVVEKADQVIGVYNAGGSSKVVKTKLEEVIRND